MQRRYQDAQLIDGVRAEFGGVNGHAVFAGLPDTADGLHGIAGSYAVAILGGIIIDEIGDGAAGRFGIGSFEDGAEVGFNRLPVIGGGCALGPCIAIAPFGHAELHGQTRIRADLIGGRFDIGRIIIGVAGDDVIHDFLRELFARSIDVRPEGGLGGFIPLGEIGVVASGVGNQRAQRGHGLVVFIHAFDGQRIERGSAIIGRIAQHVHIEDHVIDRHGRAIGEYNVVAQGDVVINAAVVVHHDVQIGKAIVGVIGAVVIYGFAFDAVLQHVAAAVAGQQVGEHHLSQFGIICDGGEERAELLAEG